MNHCRLFWNKFRFCCHNRFTVCRLWQFINCSHFFVVIRHFRNHNKLHKTFDKSRFAGTHRSDYSQIDFASCTPAHILVDIVFVHKKFPLALLETHSYLPSAKLYARGILVILRFYFFTKVFCTKS